MKIRGVHELPDKDLNEGRDKDRAGFADHSHDFEFSGSAIPSRHLRIQDGTSLRMINQGILRTAGAP